MSTGGTIAGNVASDTKTIDGVRGSEEFAEIIRATVSSIEKRWGVKPVFTAREITNVDSSNITPDVWMKLATTVKEEYDNYDSFIITHGTNTLGYTCSALSFALPNLDKPVVLTGSQVPQGEPGTDALTNLNNAVRVAVRPYAPKVKGVVAVFGSHIISGTRVKKDTEFDYDAFKSFGMASLGRIGRIINIDPGNLNRHLSYLGGSPGSRYAPAISSRSLICEARFDMRIVSLTEFPGMDPNIILTLAKSNDVQGFILRSFGAGDPSDGMRKAFEYLKDREIPIVVTTQAPNGNSNFQVNEPGRYLRENKLAIPAYDMSIESQTTKLAWLLAKKKDKEIDYKKLCEDMTTDLHGEVNPIFEIS